MENSEIILQNPQKKMNIGIFAIYIYILLLCIGHYPIMGPEVQQTWLYLFIGIGGAAILLNIGSFRIIPYFVWYGGFMLLSLFSCFYAVNQNVALLGLYRLFVVLSVMVAVGVLTRSKEDIKKILVCFSVSGFILFVILVAEDLLTSTKGRLGDELFGNANDFATLVMLCAFCSIWLILGSSGIQRIIYSVFLATQGYSLLLSGGRKYILIPLVFTYLFFYLKNDNKLSLVRNTVVFATLVALLFIAMFNIPQFYDIVGYRMEGLFGMVTGEVAMVEDTIRIEMIQYGYEFFGGQPLLGSGIDNYQVLYGHITGEYVYSHNNFMEMLVNLGVVGFVFYYSFYGYLLYKLWAKPRDSRNLREFFLAFIISLLALEIGAVTYVVQELQMVMLLASIFVVTGDE